MAHYKETHNLGLFVGYIGGNSFAWSSGVSLGDRLKLSRILASREYNSLKEHDVLAWGGASSSKCSFNVPYANYLARWRSLGGIKLGINFLGLCITLSSGF